MVTHGSIHPGLAAALEFEEQRLGLPLEVRHGHLLDLSPNTPFRPVVEVTVHTSSATEQFPVLLEDELLEISAPAYIVEDERVFGYRGRCGEVAPLAGVTGNRINIYFDLEALFHHPEHVRRRPTNGGRPGGHPAARLADLVLGPALTRAGRNIRNYNWKAERDAYARQTLQAREQQVDESRRAIRENDIAIEDRTWQIRTLAEKNAQLRDQVLSFEKLTRSRRMRQTHEDHAQIIRMLGKGLRALQIENSTLRASTIPVEIIWDGGRYEMGSYCIHIPLGTGRLTIHLEEGGSKVDGYPHPHISTDGTPCLGNIGGTLAQLLGEGEHAQAITLLLEFLRSYNEDNPYVRLEKWDPEYEDEDDRWESCYDNSALSDCATCDDDDCPHREDAQSRCYENTDTDDCIQCAGCDLHREAIDNCRGNHPPEECVTCNNDCIYADDEETCFEAHDGENCPDCNNNECTHFCEEDDDDEDPS